VINTQYVFGLSVLYHGLYSVYPSLEIASRSFCTCSYQHLYMTGRGSGKVGWILMFKWKIGNCEKYGK
jgi:hypothetical protein